MKAARIYQRVSTNEQNLNRQDSLIEKAKAEGYYIAGVYREKASGVRSDRPILNQLIDDLQEGDVIIAEHIDRITRLPLHEAEKLVNRIKEKGALLAIPNIIDLSQIHTDSEIAKIVLESVQNMLLKIALQMARDDYEQRRQRQAAGIAEAKKNGRFKGKQADVKKHQLIIELRKNHTLQETARLAECSVSLVKLVMRQYKERKKDFRHG
ncbi:MAG: recombinase family protein [Neisseria sp.]|nr:recombinase family protein [Neisseria sp.]